MLGMPLLFALYVLAARLYAQSPQANVPQWQIDAGGKMAFEVASIKQNASDEPTHTNVGLSDLDEGPPNGGLFSAVKFLLTSYIGFAYKLTPSQVELLRTQLPKWATTERFDIQARADGSPTRDQMRLMMQSLLVDRFKLAVHFETRQLPAFALVLAKAGKLGPRLQRHSDNPPCAGPASVSAPGSTPPPRDAEGFIPFCGMFWGDVIEGRVQFQARNVDMHDIADHLAVMGDLDRPVLDHTGLKGNFDLKMDTPNIPPPPGKSVQPDPSAPTFLEVLREQLGLNLESLNAPVDVLVIDHIEEPSPN